MGFRYLAMKYSKVPGKSKLVAVVSMISFGGLSFYAFNSKEPLLCKTLQNEHDLNYLDGYDDEKYQSKIRQCDQLIQRYKVKTFLVHKKQKKYRIFKILLNNFRMSSAFQEL